jgi:hypothetical protein
VRGRGIVWVSVVGLRNSLRTFTQVQVCRWGGHNGEVEIFTTTTRIQLPSLRRVFRQDGK